MNKIFLSGNYASLVLQIGVVPSQPGQPEYMYEEHSTGSITISWLAPDSDGGWPITSYLIWVDDGSGNWPLVPIEAPISSFSDT